MADEDASGGPPPPNSSDSPFASQGKKNFGDLMALDDETPSTPIRRKGKLATKRKDSATSPAKSPVPKKGKAKKEAKPKAPGKTDADIAQSMQADYDRKLPELIKTRDKILKKCRQEGLKGILPDRGVYVYDISTAGDSGAVVAGYLNLISVKQLNTILEPLTDFILSVFDKSQNAWGYSDPGFKFSFNARIFFQRIVQNEFTPDEIFSDREPSAQRFPRDGANTAYVYLHYLRFCAKVFEVAEAAHTSGKVPQVFTGPSHPEESHCPIEGLKWESEDIWRGVILLAFILNKLRKAKNNDREKDGLIQMNKGTPTLPVFLRSGGPVRTEQQTISENHTSSALRLANRVFGGPDQMLRNFRELHETISAADAAKNADDMANAVNNASLGPHVAPLPPDERRTLMQRECEWVEVMYSDPKRRNKLFCNNFDTTSNSQTKKIIDALDEQAHQQQAIRVSENNGKEPTDASVVEKHKAFLVLNNHLAENYAKHPEWDRVQALLGEDLVLEVDLPEKDDVTKDFYRVTYLGMKLKGWQAHAIAWLKEMEGILASSILSDDVGLGKTVVEYCNFCRAQNELEAESYEWTSKMHELVTQFREENGIPAWLEPLDDEDYEEPEDNGPTDLELLDNSEYSIGEVVEEALGPEPIYKPSVIVCPPNALGAWLSDHSRFFKEGGRRLILRTFCSLGSGKATGEEKERAIRGGRQGLVKFLAELDPYDPDTGRTVILTTYQSWQKHTLDKQMYTPKKASKAAAAADSDDVDDIDEDVEPEDEEVEDSIDDEQEGRVKNKKGPSLHADFNKDTFARFIIDEGHRVMNGNSLQTWAIYLWSAKFHITSATPVKGQLDTFTGLLRFLWKAATSHNLIENKVSVTAASYASLGKELKNLYGARIANVPGGEHRDEYLSAINPRNYKIAIAASNSDKMGSTNTGAIVLPLPCMIAVLRRAKGSTFHIRDEEKVLGLDIPPSQFINLEGRQNVLERSLYTAASRNIHEAYKDPLVFAGAEDEKVTQGGNLKRRRLVLASLAPKLDQLATRKVDTKATAINKLINGATDPFTFYHAYTRSDLHAPNYNSRDQIAQYICAVSTKFQILTKILLQHVIDGGEKIIIWAHEPISLFMVELLLLAYDIKFASIRSGIKAAARVKAENDYNHSPDLPVLVCSSRSASEAMNLQKGGHIMAFVDSVSLTNAHQMIGRQSRIGQEKEVIAYMITVDETADQLVQHHYHNEYSAAIAAQCTPDAAHIQTLIDRLTSSERKTMELEVSIKRVESQSAWMMNRIRPAYTDAVLRQVFGVRSSRVDEAWKHSDPRKKNLLPTEALFRIAYGGIAGNEVVQEIWLSKNPPEKPPPPPSPEELDMDDYANFEVLEARQPFALEQPSFYIKDAPEASARLAVDYLIENAEELSREFVYRINHLSPLDILREVKTWIDPDRSHDFIDQAIKRAEASESLSKWYDPPPTKRARDDDDDESSSDSEVDLREPARKRAKTDRAGLATDQSAAAGAQPKRTTGTKMPKAPDESHLKSYMRDEGAKMRTAAEAKQAKAQQNPTDHEDEPPLDFDELLERGKMETARKAEEARQQQMLEQEKPESQLPDKPVPEKELPALPTGEQELPTSAVWEPPQPVLPMHDQTPTPEAELEEKRFKEQEAAKFVKRCDAFAANYKSIVMLEADAARLGVELAKGGRRLEKEAELSQWLQDNAGILDVDDDGQFLPKAGLGKKPWAQVWSPQ